MTHDEVERIVAEVERRVKLAEDELEVARGLATRLRDENLRLHDALTRRGDRAEVASSPPEPSLLD